ncbi:Na+/H+ antiporter subunit E [Actinotalea sp. M2MS4P-6]|uniref:Na+/H+ antiporter subunit E n=1 Tax=Actinotalea sp. M2MS4P-6 TaxID=2983762 RepID=UPI0021E43E39|nr:Na+/H+ antiporter subunit E [Actinotalea sp. M2MS4P-6]MCV2392991.1 Na+/H+ antiporter subunit E [Actinotalea sp. M2MS4P-6]
MSLHPRRRGVGAHILAVAWLAGVWVALWGGLSVANVLAGVVIGVLVVRVLPMPSIDFHGRVRPIGLLRLVRHFVVDLVVASLQVAWIALSGRRPRSAVIRVRLRSHSDLYLTLTAQLCSLIPGSVVVEALRTDGVLYVHLLDVADADLAVAHADVLGIEERVLRALASDEELAEAGLDREGRR